MGNDVHVCVCYATLTAFFTRSPVLITSRTMWAYTHTTHPYNTVYLHCGRSTATNHTS
eukprot:m.287541 g.287541  ORF g.287541 m.287541 type:complete len:58 (-) comp195702_c0_seq1:248-421(-)